MILMLGFLFFILLVFIWLLWSHEREQREIFNIFGRCPDPLIDERLRWEEFKKRIERLEQLIKRDNEKDN